MRHSSFAWVGAALVVGGVSQLGCSGNGNTGGSGGTGSNSTSGSPTTTTSQGQTGPGPTTGSSTTTSSTTTGTGGGNPNPNVDCTPSTGTAPDLKLTPIATGLTGALLAKAAPDDPDRLYVVQQPGQISIIENGQVLPTPFIDLSSVLVYDGAEQGLLGLAFHPDYKNNGRFFVHYSNKGNGDSTVMEYKRSANDPHVADPTPVQLVLQHPTAQPNHNGGSTEFGPDGYLYVSLGDGGSQHDCECDAQHTDTLLGKISRLDVNATPDNNGYPAAAGNPGGNKYYHIGMRNPWRTSFDACTGDQYIGDVGQDLWEEIDVAPMGSGPLNFGWPFWEGTPDPNDTTHHHYLPANNPCNGGSPACGAEVTTGLTDPIADYHHNPECAVIGGYVYRASGIPGLRGTYFYGDYCSGKIWSLTYANGSATPPKALSINPGGGVLSGFGQNGHGEVFVVGLDGKVSRIDSQ